MQISRFNCCSELLLDWKLRIRYLSLWGEGMVLVLKPVGEGMPLVLEPVVEGIGRPVVVDSMVVEADCIR